MVIKPNRSASHSAEYIKLPDPPPQEDMTNYNHLARNGNGHHLAQYLGRQETTLIISEIYISAEPTRERRGLMAPDLLIAFNVKPEVVDQRRGYVISDHGKPPISCWKSPHPAPRTATSLIKETATRPWASRNTGVSMTPAEITTVYQSPETDWSPEDTNRSTLTGLTPKPIRGTAQPLT